MVELLLWNSYSGTVMEEQHDGTVKVGQLQWNTSSERAMVEQ